MSTQRALRKASIILAAAALLALAAVRPGPAESSSESWQGEYFANRDLTGTPALVRTDPTIDFNWGTGSPAVSIPADNFSVRWTGDFDFQAGVYRFTTETDDGVRLYIDGRLALDKWQEMAPTVFTVDVDLTEGTHALRVEYYEAHGGAVARCSWSLLAPSRQPTAAWRGEYYANPSLSGNPALTRDDARVDFDWGTSSPDPRLPADGFSVRWTRDVYLLGGTYRFTTETDDGVRLYVDDRLIIDQWKDMAPTTFSADASLTEGVHSIRVEYYEGGGGAVARLSWAGFPQPDRTITAWRGEYYSNSSLAGDPVLTREDLYIDFDWEDGSPDPRLPDDRFSVRWTRDIYLEAGRYRFTTETDDGVRLYVDGRLIIDQWRDMAPTAFSAEVDLAEGTHSVRMEYYENTGGAIARLTWTGAILPREPITAWQGEYYDNPWLAGSPVLVRDDPQVNFDWGPGSPDPRIPADGFSVRWTRDVEFRSGRYKFTVETDDGVRLYVDDRPIINVWQDRSGLITTGVWVDRGTRRIRMEYYERAGGAKARLFWQGAQETLEVGNLITCVGVRDSWIKVYQRTPDGGWLDMKPDGWGAMDVTGYLKIDGLPVDTLLYGDAGHPYRVELWSQGRLVRSVGNIDAGQDSFRIKAHTDNYTPWQCPAF